MSRTADVSAFVESGKVLMGFAAETFEKPADAESLEFDIRTLAILLVELEGRQLAHEDAQWAIWHLLEGVMEQLHDVADGVSDDKVEDYYEAFDTFVGALETSITSRAKIVCPRLEALLGDHWIEAEESASKEPGGAESGGAAEDEDEDEEDGEEGEDQP